MKWKKADGKFLVRLDKGEKLIETLAKLCKEQNIISGSFTGLGSITGIHLAYYRQQEKSFIEKVIQEELEIVSMIGNITKKDGLPYLHPHIVVSRGDFSVLAGHLKECVVGATAEVIIDASGPSAGRKYSVEIGLNLIDY